MKGILAIIVSGAWVCTSLEKNFACYPMPGDCGWEKRGQTFFVFFLEELFVCTRSATTSRFLSRQHCKWHRVHIVKVALTFAPALIRLSYTVRCPLSAARRRGVWPSLSFASRSCLFAARSATISVLVFCRHVESIVAMIVSGAWICTALEKNFECCPMSKECGQENRSKPFSVFYLEELVVCCQESNNLSLSFRGCPVESIASNIAGSVCICTNLE